MRKITCRDSLKMECLRSEKKRRLKMSFSRLKEEQKFSCPLEKERDKFAIQRTLILSSQDLSQIMSAGYPNGNALVSRRLQKRKVFT